MQEYLNTREIFYGEGISGKYKNLFETTCYVYAFRRSGKKNQREKHVQYKDITVQLKI
jgi:hypothetical protein